ncbi:MAG TPA: ferritin family protein [Methanomassiliicoccales archaeon]|nr:ferritin family protein [Methanomassiliicoccales archaeon]
MMSKIPVELGALKADHLDREILRTAMIAELDAVSLYEQLAAMTADHKIRRILLDVAREEKTHVGEFQALLLLIDPEQSEELEEGRKEVEEELG